MELRTTFNIETSPFRITYDDRVMFIGSCFASSIGEQMKRGKMTVMINPSGTVYNPVSVCNTLDSITAGAEFTKDNLHFHDGMWLSFCHYTDFSSEDPDKSLLKINSKLKEASLFLENIWFSFYNIGNSQNLQVEKNRSDCIKLP